MYMLAKKRANFKGWSNSMKRMISGAISLAVILSALVIPAFAAAKEGGNSKTVSTTISGVSSQTPVLDGKIGKYEYKEIAYTTDDLRISGTTDERLAKNLEIAKSLKLYASYSKEKVYVAVVVNTPEYVQTLEPGDMWQMHSLQVGAAKGDETTPTNRTELGFARRSDNDKLIYKLWTDAYNTGWNADTTGKDFVCVTANGVTTYELALPAKIFGVDSLNKGDKIRLNLCLNIATNSGDRGAVEWSQGTATGKNATFHALVTLGDAIKAPTAAAQTADPISAVIMITAAAAAVVVAGRKK